MGIKTGTGLGKFSQDQVAFLEDNREGFGFSEKPPDTDDVTSQQGSSYSDFAQKQMVGNNKYR